MNSSFKPKGNFFVLIIFAALIFCTAAPGRAQDKKFEFGAHYTAFSFNAADGTDSGAGVRFGYNVSAFVAVEGEANFLADTRLNSSGSGQKTQVFAGVRAGVRNKHFGAFAKVRPGAMTFYELTNLAECRNAGLLSGCRFDRHPTRFALDVGGVLEFYPSRRTIIRVDAGDTLVNFKANDVLFAGPVPTVLNGFRNNLQVSVGFGFRF